MPFLNIVAYGLHREELLKSVELTKIACGPEAKIQKTPQWWKGYNRRLSYFVLRNHFEELLPPFVLAPRRKSLFQDEAGNAIWGYRAVLKQEHCVLFQNNCLLIYKLHCIINWFTPLWLIDWLKINRSYPTFQCTGAVAMQPWGKEPNVPLLWGGFSDCLPTPQDVSHNLLAGLHWHWEVGRNSFNFKMAQLRSRYSGSLCCYIICLLEINFPPSSVNSDSILKCLPLSNWEADGARQEGSTADKKQQEKTLKVSRNSCDMEKSWTPLCLEQKGIFRDNFKSIHVFVQNHELLAEILPTCCIVLFNVEYGS